MKVVERWGSGIPRLYENCKSAGLREPELSEKAGCFRVNMFRNTELTPVTEENGAVRDDLLEEKKGTEIIERTEKIWELICKDASITQSAMMEALGISRKKVQLVLDKLVADGKIERVGSDRSGSWKINGERKG